MRSRSKSERDKQLVELARAASVGIAYSKATHDAVSTTILLKGYTEDTDKLGVNRCEAYACLATASMWWMAELGRVLASERERSIEEEFGEMGKLAAGVLP